MKVSMLLLAAGRGSRFGGDLPKAYLRIAGKSLLLRSAERLCRLADPRRGDAELLVVVHPDDRQRHLAPLLPALRALGVEHIVDGGDSRLQSMALGLAATAADSELVLVHDAARVLFPIAAARTCLQRAAEVGASLLAVEVPDTLKRVRDERVRGTLDREGIWLAQTPQVLRRELLARALLHATNTGFAATDDVSLVEHLGGEVAVVAGSPTNLKLTTAADLPLVEALCALEEHA